ncbi:hypothetical protein BU16DRAFT_161378 [Lophium mytilinum]|uniref:Uncharacterized protein n=1 Tax=Lophium mytilinum TaxID=390894 RepID=A0A6A6QBI5_9PEZI|nr:hypothetical protein BU16DRAFT_161378 [Lophium mytilinum]
MWTWSLFHADNEGNIHTRKCSRFQGRLQNLCGPCDMRFCDRQVHCYKIIIPYKSMNDHGSKGEVLAGWRTSASAAWHFLNLPPQFFRPHFHLAKTRLDHVSAILHHFRTQAHHTNTAREAPLLLSTIPSSALIEQRVDFASQSWVRFPSCGRRKAETWPQIARCERTCLARY